jgi:Domain of unknown function (DUF4148)
MKGYKRAGLAVSARTSNKEIAIMKSLIYAVPVAAVFAAPVVSFAQSNEPVTRAQVLAELVELEQVGYDPSRGEDVHYPDDIRAALALVAARVIK